MKILETSKFQRLRKRVKGDEERSALKQAVAEVGINPSSGKKLKGEFAPLRSFAYTVDGQPRRLIYRWEKDVIVLFSFGPRQGIYK
jgi:mRNA-degrading endonuclease RelE of RelBE toxin-antitoxin system